MDALAGPFAAAGALLALGGAFKVAKPLPTAGALRALGARPPVGAVRALGIGEAVVGVAAVVTGSPAFAALVSAAYLSFSAFVIVAMRSGTALQSCGCFGEVETPPSEVHVFLDLGFALTALASAVFGVPALTDTLREQPARGAPFLFLVAVTVGLSYVVLTTLPVALRAAQR